MIQLQQWLTDLDYCINSIEPASVDASFRRYFRITTNTTTFIVMDAPPDKEPLEPFLRAASDLAQTGVHTPQIYQHDLNSGFLLLEDLGTRTYLDELHDHTEPLYSDAIKALIKLQRGYKPNDKQRWPAYDHAKLDQEISLFDAWYLKRHLSVNMSAQQTRVWNELKAMLLMVCDEQPRTWVHRDYHSRNLMITVENSPGIIDFQDMVVGPIAYDLASIFKDCYIRWPREQQLQWLNQYHQLSAADYSLEQLTRWYDFTGLQRHLKVLGVFCRLYYRDAKAQYLSDLPMVADYILEVIDLYEEFSSFKREFLSLIQTASLRSNAISSC